MNSKALAKGYSESNGIFQARFTRNGKIYYLGRYHTEAEAHRAYLEGIDKYDKENGIKGGDG